MKNNVVVVVPIYKATLNPLEEVSLKQCKNILGNYDIVIVAPEGLDISFYRELYPYFSFLFLSKHHFESTISYSNLLLSSFFYENFKKYDYMLIYQMDAYVFEDELVKWCQKGYDYIGAPWILDSSQEKSRLHYKEAINSRFDILRFIKRNLNFSKGKKIFVGNGGFSLRKVSTFISISKKIHLIGIDTKKNTHNEDIIWSIYIPCFFPFYKIPNSKVALSFAFEECPSVCYNNNNNKLPFGCHAWEKNEPHFWEKYIPFTNI